MKITERKIKEIISEVLSESSRNTSEELDDLRQPFHHAFGSLSLSEINKKVLSAGLDPNMKVKFRSEGYHMNANTLTLVEPTDGSAPYILLEL